MGMDVYGKKEAYFRASIWQWRAICYAIGQSGYAVPPGWNTNDGEGLAGQEECDALAERLEKLLASRKDEWIVSETGSMRVDEQGAFVDPGTPGSRSPYRVSREHLQEFIDFLRICGGFEIR